MKHIYSLPFFGICLFISLLLNSCVKDEVETSGIIYGIVNDSDNGGAVSGANISLNPGGKTTNTGSDGRYEFLDLEPGQYTIQISKNGYDTNTKRITVVAGQEASGDMMLSKAQSRIKLSTSSLSFGSETKSMSFSISNIGTSGSVNWRVTTLVDWINITPSTGMTAQGKSSVVVVDIDRSKIIETVKTSLIVEADGESFPLEVSATVTHGEARIKLSTGLLDFGSESTSMSFNVTNTGNSGAISWSIASTEGWLKVTPDNDMTGQGKSSAVVVTVDRSKITKDVSTTLIVKADGESFPVQVKVAYKSGGSAGGNDNDVAITSCDSKVKIQFLDCVKNGSTVEFQFNLTNTSDDLRAWFSLDYFVGIDDQGNSYKGNSGTFYVGGSRVTAGTAVSFLKNVPTKCRIVMQNVKDEAKFIRRYDIIISSTQPWQVQQKKMTFENIKW